MNKKNKGEVEKVLRSLGAKGTDTGYRYAVASILIYIDYWEMDKHVMITKDIYPIIANDYNTTVYSVERNIRTVINRCWNCNPKVVNELFGYELNQKPSNADFLETVAYNIVENES